MSYPTSKLITCLAVLAASTTTQSLFAQTLIGSSGSVDPRENSVNVDWAYNWGIEPKHNVSNANYEFVPMIWSATTAGNGLQNQINRVLNLEANYGIHVDYLLGFNEPELSDQANMTVQTALDGWDQITNAFEGTDIKLVSPAVSGTGAKALDNWLYPFMDEVEARNADNDADNDLQVDAIAYHFYTVGYNATTEANKLINAIDEIWEKYERPIWLTEFAGTSFSLDNPVHSIEERTAFNKAFLEILLPAFEEREYVERVAWWQFGALGQPYSALTGATNGVYTPTELGELYSGTTWEEGDSHNLDEGGSKPTDVHYLKGGVIQNLGDEIEVALRAIDALEGNSDIGGTGDFGFEQASDAFLRVRSGATLNKIGSNTVTLQGTYIDNNGTFILNGSGGLHIRDGVLFAGSGTLQMVDGVLALGDSADEEAVRIDQALVVDGGSIKANPIADDTAWHKITQATTLNANATFSGDGTVLISGQVGGSGGITKTGSGNLILGNANSYAGPTSIQGGKLIVTSSSGSATGSGAVEVMDNGTLSGFGHIAGNVNVAAGAKVAPGVVSGPVTPEIPLNTVVDAIDFDFTGVQDDAPLTNTSTLSAGIELVSGLNFGPGTSPRGAANHGNEFNVQGFSTDDNYGAAGNRGDYLTFTIAPVEGLAIIIEDVTFELRRNGSGAAQEYVIATSIDGFTWADRWGWMDLDSTDTTTHLFTASNPDTEAVAGEIEVRITGMDASSGSGNTHFYGASLDASFVTDPNSVAFDPTGILELGGNYTQLDASTLAIDLGGTASGEFDQLLVAGDVQLDGILDLSFVEGFEAQAGETFDIITANSVSGTFDSVIGPDGLQTIVTYQDNLVQVSFSEVPEPSTLAIIIAGVFAMAGRRRRP